MAVLPDTNLLYRGGESGFAFAQVSARVFLAEGGVHRLDWQKHALDIHQQFVNLNLSPGGSADLLAATLFVNRLQSFG
jgi:triphosphoribosyl-dephospho-CoA synthase